MPACGELARVEKLFEAVHFGLSVSEPIHRCKGKGSKNNVFSTLLTRRERKECVRPGVGGPKRRAS